MLTSCGCFSKFNKHHRIKGISILYLSIYSIPSIDRMLVYIYILYYQDLTLVPFWKHENFSFIYRNSWRWIWVYFKIVFDIWLKLFQLIALIVYQRIFIVYNENFDLIYSRNENDVNCDAINGLLLFINRINCVFYMAFKLINLVL